MKQNRFRVTQYLPGTLLCSFMREFPSGTLHRPLLDFMDYYCVRRVSEIVVLHEVQIGATSSSCV